MPGLVAATKPAANQHVLHRPGRCHDHQPFRSTPRLPACHRRSRYRATDAGRLRHCRSRQPRAARRPHHNATGRAGNTADSDALHPLPPRIGRHLGLFGHVRSAGRLRLLGQLLLRRLGQGLPPTPRRRQARHRGQCRCPRRPVPLSDRAPLEDSYPAHPRYGWLDLRRHQTRQRVLRRARPLRRQRIPVSGRHLLPLQSENRPCPESRRAASRRGAHFDGLRRRPPPLLGALRPAHRAAAHRRAGATPSAPPTLARCRATRPAISPPIPPATSGSSPARAC